MVGIIEGHPCAQEFGPLTRASAFTSYCWRGLVQFNCSVVSDSLPPHGLKHSRLPYPSPTPGTCSNSCPLSWWCYPTIHPLSFPFPSAFNLSQHQGLFQWVSSLYQVAKVGEIASGKFLLECHLPGMIKSQTINIHFRIIGSQTDWR